jgi:hypothetical protein
MTVNRKVPLSDAGLTKVEAGLRELAAKLRGPVPALVRHRLATEAKTNIEVNLQAIPDLDGNEIGVVDISELGNTSRVSNAGSQVAYLEFGTGAKGGAARHIGAAEAGYVYGSKLVWFYTKDGKHSIPSHGLPPQSQVLNAAHVARSRVPSVTAAVIREALVAV